MPANPPPPLPRGLTDHGSANQQWRPVDTAGGVQLVNRLSGKALEVWEWSTTAGARLSQFDSLGGANQVWDLVRGVTFQNSRDNTC